MIDLLHIRIRPRGARVSYADPAGPPPRAKRPFVIPLFIPQAGCPHQCAFCNQPVLADRPAGQAATAVLEAAAQKFLTYRRQGRGPTQLAFYGGNFLGLSPERLRSHLDWASTYVRRGVVDSLRFSTRPDTISATRLAFLRDDPVRTVELGVQSMDDRVLARSRRGHRAADTATAVARLRQAGYEIGLQIMTGLPGDTRERAIATTKAVIALEPAFVRIYPTLVLAGSPLAADFKAGRYQPPTLVASVDLVARMWLMLTAAGIRVVRMGLQDGPGLSDGTKVLAGPHHPAFGERVLGHVFHTMAAAALDGAAPSPGACVALRVNPRRLSVMTGPQRRHRLNLEETYHLARLRISGDEALLLNQLEVDIG
ncbi:MAG: radical SAM protein [Desulfobacterales bacterium]|nr:radical SAM protein [Desulfobacterales bacterium]